MFDQTGVSVPEIFDRTKRINGRIGNDTNTEIEVS